MFEYIERSPRGAVRVLHGKVRFTLALPDAPESHLNAKAIL